MTVYYYRCYETLGTYTGFKGPVSYIFYKKFKVKPILYRTRNFNITNAAAEFVRSSLQRKLHTAAGDTQYGKQKIRKTLKSKNSPLEKHMLPHCVWNTRLCKKQSRGNQRRLLSGLLLRLLPPLLLPFGGPRTKPQSTLIG